MNERIGVVGAGVMGAGIAQVLAQSGCPVVCFDVSEDALANARHVVEDGRFGIRRAVELGKLTADGADLALARLRFSPDREEVTQADVVIEAIPEKLDLKIRLFRELDGECPAATILASNSSGFPIAALAAATDRADRVVGWHWASPAPVMRLAEIVQGPDTSDATVAVVRRLATAAGKNPVVVKDQPTAWGYVANRVYGAMLREAMRVVDEGLATRDEVDQLMVDCFRWPSGPFGMVRGATTGWKG
ncbi:MAG TPA: 3-hydroxyacyl-CoA dehydrogenase family protein [Acidimicrobiales bacterium]|jgi:3-hydroxyacyl-CoA dehydrogenase